MNLTPDTPLVELHRFDFTRLSAAQARSLAVAAANYVGKTETAEATVGDLLSYYPIRCEDRTRFLPIDRLTDGTEATVELFVRVSGGHRVGKNRPHRAPPLFLFEVTAGDADRRLRPVVVKWFISGKAAPQIVDYYQRRFARGTRFVAYGKWEWEPRSNCFSLRIAKPDELEILPDPGNLFTAALPVPAETAADDLLEDTEFPEFAMVHSGRHVPVYRKFGPFRTKRLREVIFSLLENLPNDAFAEFIPAEILSERELISKTDAVRRIHFPPDGASAADYAAARTEAHRRLIYEEFFWLQTALAIRQVEREKEPKGAVIEVTPAIRERIASLLPFVLTGAQTRVLEAILADMQSDAPMNRLIQGDVGSGKTIVAFVAMLVALENGYQAALMAPTEILAEQHFRNAEPFFSAAGYRAAMLTGSLRAAEKRRVREGLASGEIHIVVGTHAVIQDAVAFDRLGLAVIDEQHRFGVLQRAEIRARGLNPDILVMTATPIPRSLAMTLHGDLDVSVIDELPPGRTKVKTVLVGESERVGVYRGIEREIGKGGQVYIVYPLIEESEKLDLKAATNMFEELRDRVFPHHTVALMHGKMKPDEKEAVMRAFVAGDVKILVSTTVIEVGVDVPNASLMIIEHAERFGLSQLHQLRGRIGRGAEQSYCVLMTDDKKTVIADKRLKIMADVSDGFQIAEMDLDLRKEGEVLGTRQSGIAAFRLASIVRDSQLLSLARNDARKMVRGPRGDERARRLIEAVKRDPRFNLGSVG